MPRSGKVSLSKIYYHLEVGAPDIEAFFVFLDEAVRRIEFASVAFEYIIFRVVYSDRSYLFGFRKGYPYNYPERLERKIRLTPEAYHVLFHLSNHLLAAVFSGAQPKHQHKKGRLRMEAGEYFRIRSLLPSVVEVEVAKQDFTFRSRQGEYYFERTLEGMSSRMHQFLGRFLPLLMRSYTPYKRKLGERLDPLALYEGFEDEPPRKVRQLRHKRKIEELTQKGKPPKLAPPKELPKKVTPDLFAYRTLPE